MTPLQNVNAWRSNSPIILLSMGVLSRTAHHLVKNSLRVYTLPPRSLLYFIVLLRGGWPKFQKEIPAWLSHVPKATSCIVPQHIARSFGKYNWLPTAACTVASTSRFTVFTLTSASATVVTIAVVVAVVLVTTLHALDSSRKPSVVIYMSFSTGPCSRLQYLQVSCV